MLADGVACSNINAEAQRRVATINDNQLTMERILFHRQRTYRFLILVLARCTSVTALFKTISFLAANFSEEKGVKK